MQSSSECCAKCEKQGNLRRCSKCLSAFYCSRECQIADWKSHKKGCHPPEGSDGPKASRDAHPQHKDGRDTTSNAVPRNPNPNSKSNVILGVKLYSQGYSSNVSCRGDRARFVDEKFTPSHPIFTDGELCPFTALYGIPIIIFSPSMSARTQEGDNQPAVYLRIEANDGFAPQWWQMVGPGTCYVVRQDRKPLSKELVETMYQFHSSILGTDYFVDKMEGHAPYEITPKVFQKFSDRYRRENALKDGADGRG